VLILCSIQLSALHLDLPKAQEYPLIDFLHADVSASNQGHRHYHLNYPKPLVTGKAGYMGLRY
jgi:hypothetical protein